MPVRGLKLLLQNSPGRTACDTLTGDPPFNRGPARAAQVDLGAADATFNAAEPASVEYL
jgi:hypothetical protein